MPRSPLVRPAVLGLACLALACSAGRHPLEGKPAPELELLDVQGSRRALSEFFAQDTLLVFWMTGCPPCRGQLPLLESARRQLGGELQVVGIASHDALPQVVEFARELELGFPMLLDPDQKASEAYGVGAVPSAFWIEPPGRVREVEVGLAGCDMAWKFRAARRERQARAALPGAPVHAIPPKGE